jgi:hypothetical protein
MTENFIRNNIVEIIGRKPYLDNVKNIFIDFDDTLYIQNTQYELDLLNERNDIFMDCYKNFLEKYVFLNEYNIFILTRSPCYKIYKFILKYSPNFLFFITSIIGSDSHYNTNKDVEFWGNIKYAIVSLCDDYLLIDDTYENVKNSNNKGILIEKGTFYNDKVVNIIKEKLQIII